MLSRKLTALALFVLMLPVLAACGGETATPTTVAPAEATATSAAPAEATATSAAPAGATATGATSSASGTTFRWRAFSEVDTFDPALMQDFVSIDLGQNLYDGLTEFNPETLKIEPAIAQSWDTNAEGTEYTFHLRKDVKFTNGDPVTAEDFKYSWNRVLSTPEAPYVFVMDDIKGAPDVEASATSTDTTKPKLTEAPGIQVIDPYTLKVTLSRPSAYFLSETGTWTYFVINKKVVSQCPADKPSCFTETGKHMGAGTGAYYLDTWEHNQRLHFTVNPNYFGSQKASVNIEVPIVKDTSTAQAQYENGQLDAIDGPDPNDIKRLQADPKFKDQIHSVGQARAVWIGMNVMKAPFGPINDTKAQALRQAMYMGFDRQQLVDLALQGTGQPLTTFLPKGVPAYHEFDPYPFDPTKAKAKLQEAGYPNCQGLNLTYTTRDRDVEQKVATQIQAQMKDNLGCDIKVAVVPWKDMLKARQAHEYNFFYGSWGQDYPDPQDWLFALFDSSQIQGVGTGSGNDPGYSNPAFDKLVRDANGLADPAKLDQRYKMYQDAEEMLLKDAPIVPLYQTTRYWEVSPKFTGYNTNAQFIYPFKLLKAAP